MFYPSRVVHLSGVSSVSMSTKARVCDTSPSIPHGRNIGEAGLAMPTVRHVCYCLPPLPPPHPYVIYVTCVCVIPLGLSSQAGYIRTS